MPRLVFPKFRERSFLYFLLPVAIFTVIIIAVTWPLASQLSTHMISGSVETTDDIEHLRMIWWVKYALQHGLNPFYQSLFGYPDGFFSVVQWAQPLVYMPAALLGFFLSPEAAFNVWTLIVLVLNGLTTYWFCLDLLRQDKTVTRNVVAASLLGGTVFMVFPALQGHLLWGQLNIVSNYGLPLAALCLNRILTGRGNKRTAVLGALAIWVLLISNYTSIVFLILPLVLFGGGYWLLRRRNDLRALGWRLPWQLGIVFGGAALMTLPFYLPMIMEALDPSRAAYLQSQGAGWILFSADILSFVALSPFTPWTKPFAPPFSYNILNANITEGTAYLGVIACVLAIIAIARQGKTARVWFVILVGSMVFSLGPMLKWKEQPVVYTLGLDKSNIVLPWAVFQNLPLLDIIRTPGRFNIMSGFALGVLAGLGLKPLVDRIGRQGLSIATAALLIVGVVGEYQLRFPFPTYPVSEPAYFDQLATRSDIRAVFDVPYTETHKQALLEQMEHHKSIIAGYYARLTPVDPAKLMLLSEAARGRAWVADSTAVGFPGKALEPDDARTVLKDNGIDVIVYHWALLDKPSTMNWAIRAFGEPAYQDDQIAAFEIPPPAQLSRRLIMTHEAQYWWPFTPPTYGWWPADPDSGGPPSVSAQNTLWMRGGAQIIVYAPESTLQQFTFQLTPLLRASDLSITLDGYPFHSWNVRLPSELLSFWLGLQGGFHTLVLDAAKDCTPITVPPSCLVDGANQAGNGPACNLLQNEPGLCVSMRVSALQTAEAQGAYQVADLHLDKGLILRGFWVPDTVVRGNVMPVQVDWRATERLGLDYHIFIHVLGPDGKLVTQYDGVPGDGGYPTTKWAVPQNWTEAVGLPISTDLRPGVYEVYTGWYSYPDMTRVGVEGEGKGAADGLAHLKSITIQ